jgi:hypothetical protein
VVFFIHAGFSRRGTVTLCGKVLPRAISRERPMPIDWASVNWIYVALLSAFAFLGALIGMILSMGNRLLGAVLAAVIFAAIFIFWTYYPHGFVVPGLKAG